MVATPEAWDGSTQKGRKLVDAVISGQIPTIAARGLAGRSVPIRSALIESRACPAHVLAECAAMLRDTAYYTQRSFIAANVHTPACVLRSMSNDVSNWVVSAVAANPATPPDTLRALARDRDSRNWTRQMSCQLAGNPSCPPDALEALARRDDTYIHAQIAGNSACPPQTLSLIAGSARSMARQSAAENPNCPAEDLKRLAGDADPFVAQAAIANPSLPRI